MNEWQIIDENQFIVKYHLEDQSAKERTNMHSILKEQGLEDKKLIKVDFGTAWLWDFMVNLWVSQ
jgi:predicted urease superfamily metal-dependent hydrolase